VAGPVRRERVAEQMRQELSDVIQREIRDPRKGWVTVTRVEMSPDLHYAKVFVSVYGDEEAQQVTMKVLTRAASFIRGVIGRRVRLRQTPELRFFLDDSIKQSQRILDLLRETDIPPDDGDEAEAGQ
jgi:ribosome-binding factor A